MIKIQQLASVLAVVALAGTLLPASAEATLIGDTINAQLLDATGATLFEGSSEVGAGAEFLVDLGNGTATQADFDAENLYLSFIGEGFYDPFTWIFSDLDWVGQSGAIVDVRPVDTPAESTIVSFTEDSFVVSSDLGRLEGDPLTDIFHIQARHFPNGNVPEPGVLVLLAAGLVGLARTRRRS